MFSLLRKTKSSPGLTGIGLDSQGVGLARVRRTGGRPQVVACEHHAWPGVGDPAKLTEQLASRHDLKHSRCATLLGPDDYNLLLTEAPEVPDEELRAALRWRIKDLIDFPVQSAVIDVFDLPGERLPGRQRSVYVVAARNEAVRHLAEQLTGHGVLLDVIDIPELVQRNLASLLPQDERGVATLSFTASGGLITITRQGELYLSRSLEIGFDQLESDDGFGNFDRISLEVQRSLDYYDSYFRMAAVSDLVLLPLPIDATNLLNHLNANLSLTASQMDLNQVLDFQVDVSPQHLYGCLWSLGLALREDEAAA